MTRPVHGYGMYGMGGLGTDPNQAVFSNRVRVELGVNIHNSPYRDYQCNQIASNILMLPPDAIVLVWGSSLGANDCPVVGAYAARRTIHGLFGFQASLYGAKMPLTANVLFAHLIYSYNPIPFPGLGAYKWKVGTMNPISYHATPHHIPHPGDYNKHDQDLFLGEMARIIENPGD